jgi:hypothetical protein
MADPEALKAAAQALEPVEASPAWETAPPAPRARALWNRAVLEIFSLLLEGEPVAAAVERAAPRLRAARALDAAVADSGEQKLSPRIRDQAAHAGR